MLTISPYFVLDAGPPTSASSGESNSTPASYREHWGLVVVTRFTLGHGF